MNAKIKAHADKQEDVCRQTLVRANMPIWAVDKCMATCRKWIRIICQCWMNGESEGYEQTLNKLTSYLNDASKRSWHSVPPPLIRLQGESIEYWVDRMYKDWFKEDEEDIGF